MQNDKLIAIAIFIIATIATKTSASDLLPHNAPFGLRFGMKLQEVNLPQALPPESPKKRPTQSDNTTLNSLVMFYLTDEERRELEQYKILQNAYESLVEACQATFDIPYLLNYPDRGWLSWIREQKEEASLTDLDPIEILSTEQYGQLEKYEQQVEGRGYPKPADFRKLSIHKIETAGDERRRLICLVFTEDGLTHLYVPHNGFEDVIGDIYDRLDGNPEYATYKSRRHSKRSENQHVFTVRRFWLDSNRRAMVSSKHFQTINRFGGNVNSGGVNSVFSQALDSFTAHIETIFRKDDFIEPIYTNYFGRGLPPYIAYTDLARRTEIKRRYRTHTYPILSAAINAAVEADSSTKKIKAEIERARNNKKEADRKGLVESFR